MTPCDGRAERLLSDQPSLEQPCDGRQLGDLERLVARQGREDGGQPSREHRLADARRAPSRKLSGGRHLQGATRLRLPSHLGDVDDVPADGRLDGYEMTTNPDDGDAGDVSLTT